MSSAAVVIGALRVKQNSIFRRTVNELGDRKGPEIISTVMKTWSELTVKENSFN